MCFNLPENVTESHTFYEQFILYTGLWNWILVFSWLDKNKRLCISSHQFTAVQIFIQIRRRRFTDVLNSCSSKQIKKNIYIISKQFSLNFIYFTLLINHGTDVCVHVVLVWGQSQIILILNMVIPVPMCTRRYFTTKMVFIWRLYFLTSLFADCK